MSVAVSSSPVPGPASYIASLSPSGPHARETRLGLIGRERELDAIDAALSGGARLVTLWGPGGIGKTTLCSAAARAWSDQLVACDLTEARSAADVLSAVLAAIHRSCAGGDQRSEVARALAQRGPTLLVLDNVEQIVQPVSELVEHWLASAPELRVLVTSRERLRIDAERCVEVTPLSLPDASERDPRRIAESDSVRLFLRRARSVTSATLVESDDELLAAAELVRRVEGIPLAIELCASRMILLGTRQLVELLAHGLDVLRNDRRAAPSRHATMRDAIAWSWNLLSEREQRALAQCSVFRGGFGLEAAVAVLDLAEDAPLAQREVEAIEVLQELRDRSLIRAIEVAGLPGVRRFSLYEPVRELAAERLAQADASLAEQTAARHSAHYCEWGRTLARVVAVHDGVAARRRLALERDNLVAVVQRALAAPTERGGDALAALAALEPITVGCAGMPLPAYVELLDAALASAPEPTSARAAALIARGNAALVLGGFDAAAADYQAALSSALRAGALALATTASRQLRGLATIRLQPGPPTPAAEHEAPLPVPNQRGGALMKAAEAVALLRSDQLGGAQRLALEARAQFAAAGDVHNEGMLSALVGHIATELGAFGEAERENLRAIDLLQEVAERRLEAPATANLGRVAQAQGDLVAAAAYFERAALLGAGVTHRWLEGLMLSHLAAFELERGQSKEAERAFTDAALAFRDVGDVPHAVQCEAGQACARAMTQAPGSRRAPATLERGEPDTAGLPATTRAIVLLRRGLAALASADEDGSESRAARAQRCVEEARAIMTVEGVSALDVSESARQAGRLLLARAAVRVERAVVLHVGPDARWFEIDGEARVDLSRRPTLRAVLLALVDEHLRGRGDAATLDVDALFAAGWPSEKAREGSISNRVYVTLSKLRRLGLRPALETCEAGVRLRANVSVVRHAGASPSAG